MFTAAKDAMTGKAAQAFINERMAPYGKVERLKIDSKARRIEASCLLHGETAPISVVVGRYEIETTGGASMVRLHECTCSKPWMQNLLRDFAERRPFPLPSWVAAALV